MSVSSAVDMWNTYIRPYNGTKYLVSPSVANGKTAKPTMSKFLETCGGDDDNCGVSCILFLSS
jgi:hypothetical protein